VKSDVFISLPKLKTHHKVGVTLNMKGLVGINALKNLVVHWRIGFPAIGGDEYPNIGGWLKSKTEKVTHRGAWIGNDTAWRMVVDLYDGLCTFHQRHFSVIDGILAGERNGPFCPRAKQAGVLLAGENLPAVDCVATRLMGFDVLKVRYLKRLIERGDVDLNRLEIISDEEPIRTMFQNNDPLLAFEPGNGWGEMVIAGRPIVAMHGHS
jgi:uncharacterized protein (DUF362 family)